MVKGLTEPPGSRYQREPAGLVPFSGFEKVAAQMRAIGESVVEKEPGDARLEQGVSDGSSDIRPRAAPEFPVARR